MAVACGAPSSADYETEKARKKFQRTCEALGPQLIVVHSYRLWGTLPLYGRMGCTVGHFDTWHYAFGSTDLGRLKGLMLGMEELTKQNGEERRARLGLGVKPLSAAVPDESVQQEKMTNVSQVGLLGAPRDAEETQQHWCDLSHGNGRFVGGELRPRCVLCSWHAACSARMIATTRPPKEDGGGQEQAVSSTERVYFHLRAV
jgi:hypothetical protein